MEPLEPEIKDAILRSNPQVDRALIEEYERLMAQEFASDPDAPQKATERLGAEQREERLAELYQQLFVNTGLAPLPEE